MEHVIVQNLYEQNSNSLYRLCIFYLKNEQDAFDAMQNTFVKLLKYQGIFSSKAHAKNWLMCVAANECKNLLRHWWRENAVLEDYMLPEHDNVGIYLEQQALLEEIMRLPKNSRITLYLYYYEGYSTGEIAMILGVRDSTVRSALTRGRKKLKMRLEDADYEGKRFN